MIWTSPLGGTINLSFTSSITERDFNQAERSWTAGRSPPDDVHSRRAGKAGYHPLVLDNILSTYNS